MKDYHIDFTMYECMKRREMRKVVLAKATQMGMLASDTAVTQDAPYMHLINGKLTWGCGGPYITPEEFLKEGSMKFKVGDTVKVVAKGFDNQNSSIGVVAEVSNVDIEDSTYKISHEALPNGWEWFFESSLEAVDEGFKYGDKIIDIQGTVGIVISTLPSGKVLCYYGNEDIEACGHYHVVVDDPRDIAKPDTKVHMNIHEIEGQLGLPYGSLVVE